MLNKEIWSKFWNQLQADIAETLQDRILNFDTAIGIIGTLITYFYPEMTQVVLGSILAYLGYRKS